jgi:hypothetical protein
MSSLMPRRWPCLKFLQKEWRTDGQTNWRGEDTRRMTDRPTDVEKILGAWWTDQLTWRRY